MHHCFRLTNPQTHHHHHPVPSFHTHTHTLKRTNSKGWRTFFFSRVTPDVPEPHIHTTTSPPRFSFSLFLLFCPSSSLIWSFCSCVFIDPPLSSHCFLYCFLQHLFFFPPLSLCIPPSTLHHCTLCVTRILRFPTPSLICLDASCSSSRLHFLPLLPPFPPRPSTVKCSSIFCIHFFFLAQSAQNI